MVRLKKLSFINIRQKHLCLTHLICIPLLLKIYLFPNILRRLYFTSLIRLRLLTYLIFYFSRVYFHRLHFGRHYQIIILIAYFLFGFCYRTIGDQAIGDTLGYWVGADIELGVNIILINLKPQFLVTFRHLLLLLGGIAGIHLRAELVQLLHFSNQFVF